jgi:hypothetical protein
MHPLFVPMNSDSILRRVQKPAHSRSLRIEYPGFPQYIVANMAIESITGNEVDRTTKQRRKFVPHALESHQADSGFVLEVDQDIDIAVVTLFAAGQRTENGQFPYGMGSTKPGYRSGGKRNLGRHGDYSNGNAAQFTSEPTMPVAP